MQQAEASRIIPLIRLHKRSYCIFWVFEDIAKGHHLEHLRNSISWITFMLFLIFTISHYQGQPWRVSVKGRQQRQRGIYRLKIFPVAFLSFLPKWRRPSSLNQRMTIGLENCSFTKQSESVENESSEYKVGMVQRRICSTARFGIEFYLYNREYAD